MKKEKKQPPRQHLSVEYAGTTIEIPIYVTSVTVRDLELQKKAWIAAAEEAFHEYMYVNRLGRYKEIPPDKKAS